MNESWRGTGATAALLVLLAILVAAPFLLERPSPEPEARAADIRSRGPEPELGLPEGVSTPERTRGPVLSAREVCGDAGYLCASLVTDEVDEIPVLRWPASVRRIRVELDPPEHETGARAEELRRAADRGIRAWDGHPRPIEIVPSVRAEDGGAEPQIRVRWVRTLDDEEVGRVRTRWLRDDSGVRFEVLEFLLTTRRPGTGVPLTPDEVRLTSAHEMGHALGLRHSDDPRDLMYPENTARGPTVRDYRTLAALYSLPNGAVIRP